MPQPSARTKIALSIIFVIALASFVMWQMSNSGTTVVVNQQSGTSAPQETTNPSAGGNPPTPTPTPATSGQSSGTAVLFKDGSYTGNATDAYYGTVQVKAIIKNGQLADVQFLQYPNDREHSLELSQMAMPILTQEAISAQSSQVDIVSGATQTSQAFQDSLASALVLAKS